MAGPPVWLTGPSVKGKRERLIQFPSFEVKNEEAPDQRLYPTTIRKAVLTLQGATQASEARWRGGSLLSEWALLFLHPLTTRTI